MKTAVSIPKDVLEHTDVIAKRLQRSRNAVLGDALREYIDRHDVDAITEALNATFDELDHEELEFVRAAARRTLASSEW